MAEQSKLNSSPSKKFEAKSDVALAIFSAFTQLLSDEQSCVGAWEQVHIG